MMAFNMADLPHIPGSFSFALSVLSTTADQDTEHPTVSPNAVGEIDGDFRIPCHRTAAKRPVRHQEIGNESIQKNFADADWQV
jgi:hypothetical protein